MESAIKFSSRIVSCLVVASTVGLAWAAGTGAARASEPVQYLTEKVAYGDLNLDTAAGAKTLYIRLRYAAKHVCSPVAAEPRDLNGFHIWQSCVDSAIASAVEQVNKPMLSGLHDLKVSVSRTG
ncbi:MAG TPA: UrcA family protein [Steroidobacteraceae bacterium]|jgi:UrcA family protein